MDLKRAMSIAELHAGDEHCVTLTPGWVDVHTPVQGCSLPCPAVDLTATVQGGNLTRAVRAIGLSEVTLSQVGRRLRIAGPHASYELATIKKQATDLAPPPHPLTGGVTIPAEAIRVLSSFASSAPSTGALTGVRFGADYGAVATPGMVAVVWVKMCPTPCTLPASFVAPLSGEQRVYADPDDDFVWCLGADGGYQYSLPLATEWPEASLFALVSSVRGKRRYQVDVSGADLLRVATQATAMLFGKVEAFGLRVEAGNAVFGGESGGRSTSVDFPVIPRAPTGVVDVALNPLDLQAAAKILQASGTVSIGFADPSDPIVLWSDTDPQIEVLLTPVWRPT